MVAGTTTIALESGVSLSSVVSASEEVDSWLLSIRLPGYVSKGESCKVSVTPESKTGVSVGLENQIMTFSNSIKIKNSTK